MYALCDTNENEIGAVFLRRELPSTRFGHCNLANLKCEGQSKRSIDRLDLDDSDENAYRSVGLGEHRECRTLGASCLHS